MFSAGRGRSRPVGKIRYQQFLNRLSQILVLRAIRAYRRYISPYKGFCCAYHSITGRLTCSQFADWAIEKHGTVHGLRLTFRRMRRCSYVYSQHQSFIQRSNLFGGRLRHQSGHCDLPVEGCHGVDTTNLADCACNCLPSPCDFWTSKQVKKKPGVRFSDSLVR
jgi:putative component of membrane protein insertase Oxa1/YidC/SpoIIIJ protein YidD